MRVGGKETKVRSLEGGDDEAEKGVGMFSGDTLIDAGTEDGEEEGIGGGEGGRSEEGGGLCKGIAGGALSGG